MRIFIDNRLLRILCKDTSGSLWDSFLDICDEQKIIIEDRRVHLKSDWAVLLEFIGLGNILNENKCTKCSEIGYLGSIKEPTIDQINEVIDNLFLKFQNQCKSISSIETNNLITKIKEQKKECIGKGAKIILPIILDPFEKFLIDNPNDAYESLIIYLAWDRLSVQIATYINYNCSSQKKKNIAWSLFEQLMGTFHHICIDLKKTPGFFRLTEAAYLCKQPSKDPWVEEYKNKYKLKLHEDLCDISYIDFASMGFIEFHNNKITQYPIIIFTLDKPEQVNARLKIAKYMLHKLKDNVEGWLLNPCCTSEVLCLTKTAQLNFNDRIQIPIFQNIKTLKITN